MESVSVTDLPVGAEPTVSENSCIESSDVEGPAAKRLKASVETSTVDEIPLKGKNRTYAMLMSYIGIRYLGVQINGDSPTIEKELVSAFCKAGLLQEGDKTPLRTLSYNRAARTDKRVSAVQQVVSFHCRVQPPGLPKLKQKLNENLPDDIRIVDIRRGTKGFNARYRCVLRTYTYMLPSFAFAHEAEQTDLAFRLSDVRRAEVNDVFSAFEGTHNFFNFTPGKEINDSTSTRHIKSFNLQKEAHIYSGVEFVIIEVVGQSFMMHQIRKMVGLAIAIVRGVFKRDSLDYVFSPKKLKTPLAPGLGLVLNSLSYDAYNKQFAKTHDQLDWDNEKQPELKQFKEKILSNIVEAELKDNLMMEWLNHDLPMFTREFLDDAENGESPSKSDQKVSDDKETNKLSSSTEKVPLNLSDDESAACEDDD